MKILMIFGLIISVFFCQLAYSQESQLTMEQIILMLRATSRTATLKAAANKTLAREISKRGVDFALDKEAERILRLNFANNKLILAIKQSIAEKKSPQPKKELSSKKVGAVQEPTNDEEYLVRAKNCNKYDFDCQIKNFNKALELNPQNAVAYKLRGDSYSSKGDDTQAISDYTKAIELDPKFSTAYRNRSTAYLLKREIEKSLLDATKYIELKPDVADGYAHRGDLNGITLSNYEEAIADYSKAIEINPKNYLYYDRRAKFYRYSEKYEPAIADYLKSLSVGGNPVPEGTYHDLGFCYDQLGQYQKSIDSYTKAIEIDPKEPMAYNFRAKVYEKIGDTKKAEADRKKYEQLIADFLRRIK